MGRRNSRTKDLQCSRADYRGKRQNSIAKDKEGQISDLQRELERRTPVQMPSMLQQNLHAPSSRTGIKQEPGTPSSESDVSYLLSRRRAYSSKSRGSPTRPKLPSFRGDKNWDSFIFQFQRQVNHYGLSERKAKER